MPRRRKPRNDAALTSQYQDGAFGEEAEDREIFNKRSKHQQSNKTARTAERRAGQDRFAHLPVGRVVQVFSLYVEVEGPPPGPATLLCTVRKTLARTSETQIIVGDSVRFLATGGTETDVAGRMMPEAVIEAILPRRTVLTRADSFKGREQHPVVANADAMLITVAYARPRPKWGLVDRMIVAARAGGLEPVICLNKMDLAEVPDANAPPADPEEYKDTLDDLLHSLRRVAEGEPIPIGPSDGRWSPADVLDYYASLGIATVRTSVERQMGLADLRGVLRGRTTVLAGHSGVGKSSLIASIQPTLDLRVGPVSEASDKGMHTTTSGRRYPMHFPDGTRAAVVDTPGVKVFGLWDVGPEQLAGYFPDVEAGTAPAWREASYRRLLESIE